MTVTALESVVHTLRTPPDDPEFDPLLHILSGAVNWRSIVNNIPTHIIAEFALDCAERLLFLSRQRDGMTWPEHHLVIKQARSALHGRGLSPHIYDMTMKNYLRQDRENRRIWTTPFRRLVTRCLFEVTRMIAQRHYEMWRPARLYPEQRRAATADLAYHVYHNLLRGSFHFRGRDMPSPHSRTARIMASHMADLLELYQEQRQRLVDLLFERGGRLRDKVFYDFVDMMDSVQYDG